MKSGLISLGVSLISMIIILSIFHNIDLVLPSIVQISISVLIGARAFFSVFLKLRQKEIEKAEKKKIKMREQEKRKEDKFRKQVQEKWKREDEEFVNQLIATNKK